MAKDEGSAETSKEEKKSAKKKQAKTTKFRKAPQAPKRFKSAFIFFSVQKHPEIRETMEAGKSSDAPNVAKLVSEAWRNLPPEERAIWEKKAEDDKKRYEMERKMYTGPWKIPASKRAKKDPDAPKRPMSAFLAYSKNMRSQVKGENPHLSNTEVSRLLADKWKVAPTDIRDEYIKKEAEEREVYKVNIAEWRAKQEEKMEAQRKQREQIAQMAIANGALPTGDMPPYDHGYPPSAAAYGYGPPPGHEMGGPPMAPQPPHGMAHYDPSGYAQHPQHPHAPDMGQGQEYWGSGMPDPSQPQGPPGSNPNNGYWAHTSHGMPHYPPDPQQPPYGEEAYGRSDTQHRMGYGPPEAQGYYGSDGFAGYPQHPHQAYPPTTSSAASYPPATSSAATYPPTTSSAGSYPPSDDRMSQGGAPQQQPPAAAKSWHQNGPDRYQHYEQQPPQGNPQSTDQYYGAEKYPDEQSYQGPPHAGYYAPPPPQSYPSDPYDRKQYAQQGHYEYS